MPFVVRCLLLKTFLITLSSVAVFGVFSFSKRTSSLEILVRISEQFFKVVIEAYHLVSTNCQNVV